MFHLETTKQMTVFHATCCAHNVPAATMSVRYVDEKVLSTHTYYWVYILTSETTKLSHMPAKFNMKTADKTWILLCTNSKVTGGLWLTISGTGDLYRRKLAGR
jgi:hypothetical protein